MSENEGELKKRIHNLFVPIVKTSNKPVFVNLAEATKQVVDEAKQEFLEELGEVGDVDPETLEEKFWPLFHKWFGDSSDSS